MGAVDVGAVGVGAIGIVAVCYRTVCAVGVGAMGAAGVGSVGVGVGGIGVWGGGVGAIPSVLEQWVCSVVELVLELSVLEQSLSSFLCWNSGWALKQWVRPVLELR